MKITLFIFSFFLISVLFSGCATSGFGTAKHNGKMYYFPENCRQYRYSYSDPDTLKCVNDGVETGQVIRPADSEQLAAYQQKRQNERDVSNALEQFNQNMQNLNQQQQQFYNQQQQYYQQQQMNNQLYQMNNNLRGIRYGY